MLCGHNAFDVCGVTLLAGLPFFPDELNIEKADPVKS